MRKMHGQTNIKNSKCVTVNTHMQREGIFLLFVLFKKQCGATTKENRCDEGMWPFYVKATKDIVPLLSLFSYIL